MAFPYYPYNPYQYQQPQQNSGLIWVQGIEAMKSYPVQAGQSVLLMDSETSCFGIKTVDASGMPQPLRIFDYQERKQPARATESPSAASFDTAGFVTREEFEARIAQICAKYEKDGEENE